MSSAWSASGGLHPRLTPRPGTLPPVMLKHACNARKHPQTWSKVPPPSVLSMVRVAGLGLALIQYYTASWVGKGSGVRVSASYSRRRYLKTSLRTLQALRALISMTLASGAHTLLKNCLYDLFDLCACITCMTIDHETVNDIEVRRHKCIKRLYVRDQALRFTLFRNWNDDFWFPCLPCYCPM